MKLKLKSIEMILILKIDIYLHAAARVAIWSRKKKIKISFLSNKKIIKSKDYSVITFSEKKVNNKKNKINNR
jgi:hypothetical protein